MPGGGLGRALSYLDGPATAQAAVPFREPLPIPPELTAAKLEIPISVAEQQILPGRKTQLWTFGGSFPGPTIRRPAGERTEVTFRHELPKKVGELSVHLHGAHSRTQFDGQPGGLTAVPALQRLLQHPLDLSPQGLRQRPAAEAGRAQTLRLRPDRGRRPRTRRVQVVPRPPPRPDRVARLARDGGDVHRRRRARGIAAAADRRARHRDGDRRPHLRRPQPADRPVHRPAPARRRDPRRHGPGQRRLHAPPPRRRAPLPPADPQRLPVPRLRPLPLQRRAADPDRRRRRPDAAADPPRAHPDRPGRAGRGDRRLRPLARRHGRAPQPPQAARPQPARLARLRRRADAVPRRLRPGPRRDQGPGPPAPAPRLDPARRSASPTTAGRSPSAASSRRSGRSTARPSTPPTPTPRRGSGRPSPGSSTTRPRSPT